MANNKQINIRLADLADSLQIGELCKQLGYPTSAKVVEQRLHHIQQHNSHAVYVAESIDKHVVGWVHIYVCPILMSDLQATIGGLVIDESDRGYGIGRKLMQRAQGKGDKGTRGQGDKGTRGNTKTLLALLALLARSDAKAPLATLYPSADYLSIQARGD